MILLRRRPRTAWSPPSTAPRLLDLLRCPGGVAEKWLGWTRPGSSELPQELTTISQSTGAFALSLDAVDAGEEVSEDFPKALKWQDAEDEEPEPAAPEPTEPEPAALEPAAVEPPAALEAVISESAATPEPAAPEPVAVPEPQVEEALPPAQEPPEAQEPLLEEAPLEAAAPAAPLEEAEVPGAAELPEPNPFAEPDVQRLREDLAEAQGLLKQRERGPLVSCPSPVPDRLMTILLTITMNPYE